jgi:hypothetical protein
MTHFTATQKVIDAADAAGFATSYCISNTNFGTSEYVYIRLNIDNEALKVRISDHGVSNNSRVFNEVHVGMNEINVQWVVNEANFKFRRNDYFEAKEIIVETKAFKVQATTLWANDVVTEEFISKKGNKIYIVTRTYRNESTAWVNKQTGEIFTTIKK